MAIGFITGRMGTDRTSVLLDMVMEDAKINSNKPIIILVPEQYTHEMEKKVSERLMIDKDRYFRIRVLSFSTLSNIVFTTVGGLVEKRIQESTRNILMYKAMLNVSRRLKTFKVGKSGVGLIGSMNKMIDEFKVNSIGIDDLKNAYPALNDEAMSMKLEDFYHIYKEYNSLMEGRFVDSVDSLGLFAKNIDDLDMIEGASIYIDEFSSFMPVQKTVIEKIMLKAEKVYFSLMMDINNIYNDKGVFFEVNRTYREVLDFAVDNNIPRLKDVNLSDRSMFKNGEMMHIEENISRYRPALYPQKSSNVSVYPSVDPYREIDNIARSISIDIRERGYRFRDIALVIRNLNDYRHIVESVFNDYGISYFMDIKEDSRMNPVVVFIMNMIDIKRKRYSYQSMFSYLKSGLLGLSIDEVSVLENYVLANGIKGKRWFREWDKPIEYSVDEYDSQNEKEEIKEQNKNYKHKLQADVSMYEPDALGENIEESSEGERYSDTGDETIIDIDIEKLRKRVMDPIERFDSSITKDSTVRDIASSLYVFACDIGLPDKIDSMIEEFEENGDLQKSREYSQIWNVFIDMLDEMVQFLGDDKMNIGKFYQLLETEITSIKIGVIPPKNDQVLVTEPSRMRKTDIRSLYVAGVSEDVFPKRLMDDSMMTSLERKKLKEVGIKFYQSFINRILGEQMLVYKSLASSSERIMLTYPLINIKGDNMNPSPIISKLESMFGDSIYSPQSEEGRYITKSDLFNLLCIGISGDKRLDVSDLKDEIAIFRYLSNDESYSRKLDLIRGSVEYKNNDRITKELAHQIYGKGVFSVSKLERYAMCPYSYFVNYGLRAKKRREYSFVPLDSGIYTHKIIDEFSKNLQKNHILWREVDDEYINSEVRRISNEIFEKKSSYILNSSERFKALSNRINNMITSSISVMAEQIKRGLLEPRSYESEFGIKAELPAIRYTLEDKTPITIVGKIDRIDSYFDKDEGVEFIRVVDYKSSKNVLDLNRIYYGLQMQLFMYMNAISNYKRLIDKSYSEKILAIKYPAALSYMEIKNPVVTLDKFSKDAIKSNRHEEELKETKLKGYVVKDLKVIEILDNTLDHSSNKKSSIMDITLKKDGIASHTKGLEIEEFNVVSKFVSKKAKDISENIYSGAIDISPYKYDSRKPCDYCDFKSICKFDESFEYNNYRLLRKLEDESILNKMSKEVDDKDGK